jgi:hypothetical protein
VFDTVGSPDAEARMAKKRRTLLITKATTVLTKVERLHPEHRVDTQVPIEDVAGTMKDLIREGKSSIGGFQKREYKRYAAHTLCSL